MKKNIMRIVRSLLQLLPKSLRGKIKKSEWLTTFYVKSVRKSGLFFDAPTAKQTQELYEQWLLLNTNRQPPVIDYGQRWQAIIFGSEGSTETKKSLQEQGVDTFFCIDHSGCTSEEESLNVDTFRSVIGKLDKSIPTLLLNGRDTLAQNALAYFVNSMENSDIVYCDTDELSENGIRGCPRFLPDWNPELHFSTAYVRTGVLVKTSVLSQLNFLDISTVSELVNEIVSCSKQVNVNHISFPLVHTQIERSQVTKELLSVKQSLERHYSVDILHDEARGVNSIMWRSSEPLISLIIPTKNGKELVKACIESIIEKTTYTNYEILLIDNGSDESDSLKYFDYLNTLSKVRVLKYPFPFNYSAINNFGVQHANGSVIGLINNDIEVISPQWLNYMVGHVQRSDVGCVGAKLLYSDTRIQHAGVVLGYGGGAGHAHKNFPRNHTGYLNRIIATNNYSAVTAACLLVKRSHFEQVGGLNEERLKVAFNDVDFCLRVQQLGVNNVYCAEAELYHHESVSRGLDLSPEKVARFDRELEFLKSTWSQFIKNDPAYSANLTLKRENFSIKARNER